MRLANATIPVYPNEHQYNWMRSILLEYRNGKSYAVATNSKILAAEYIDTTTEPNAVVNIVITDALLTQCAIEQQWSGELIIDVTDTAYFKYASLTTLFGYRYPDNAALFPPDVINSDDTKRWFEFRDNWRRLVPDETPTASKGFMFQDTELLTLLGKSAPSGCLVYPKHIDVDKPLMVRDAVDPSWLGLFVSYSSKYSKGLIAAKRPEWL